jgi:hypothetical protein
MNLLTLNLDALVHVLDQLQHEDVFNFALTSRGSYTIASSHFYRNIKLVGLPQTASFSEFIESPRGTALQGSIHSLVVDIEEYVADIYVAPDFPKLSDEELGRLNEMSQCSERVLHMLGRLLGLRRLELFDAGFFTAEEFGTVISGLPYLSAISLSRTNAGTQLLSRINRPLDTLLLPEFCYSVDPFFNDDRLTCFDVSHFSSTLRTLSLDLNDLGKLPNRVVFSRVAHLVVWACRPPNNFKWPAIRTIFPNLCILEYLTLYNGPRARARFWESVLGRKRPEPGRTPGLLLYTDARYLDRIDLFKLGHIYELSLEGNGYLALRVYRPPQPMLDLAPTVISLSSWHSFHGLCEVGLPSIPSVKRIFTPLPERPSKSDIDELVCQLERSL